MNLEILHKPVGYLLLLVAFVLFTGAGIWWQHSRRQPVLAPAVPAAVAALPRVFTREGARFVPPAKQPEPPVSAAAPTSKPVAVVEPRALPLRLFEAVEPKQAVTPLRVPPGRLIPCETVTVLESSRQNTPVIALVTEDVWAEGRRVVAAGTEVHGRFALDRARDRLTADGAWTFNPPRDGTSRENFVLQATALERDIEAGRPGPHDGSAGLPGKMLRTDDLGELKLFAATFLSTATLALQDLRSTGGLVGETTFPAATARNATLAGTSAVLRDYAQQLKDAIARDGFYIRVPAGTPFYLYVTSS